MSLLALTAMPALAQDKPQPAAPAMDSAAGMDAMVQAAAPGEPQKKLARFAGDWTFTNNSGWLPASRR